MIEILNYINGEHSSSISQERLDVINPANGKVYAQVANSNSEDVELAYVAAKNAFKGWSESSISDRSRILMKIANLIESQIDELAMAESIDNGKPLWLAKKVDIPRAAANFRFFANAITQFASESHSNTNSINYTLRSPIGVVACISPWNLPLYLFTWKIAPALAAGNTVIAKPSEITPMTAFLLTKICQKAGLPKGVLNVIHGAGHRSGDAISNHEGIKAISFTGSTKIGSHIASIAAPKFKKLSLELGGKNPNIIFADCDFDKMLRTTINSSFANQGQICLCGSRILVERKIYEKFRSDFVVKVKKLKVGNPLLDDTKVGALVSKSHFEKVLSYIELAKEEGGRVLCGGNIVNPNGLEKGYYIEPTVIVDLPYNCRTNTEEIFGPVVTITPFESEDEAIKMANSTDYGLSCTIWTSDLNRTQRISKKVEAGIVWVNTWLNRDLRTPFGGVKNSGVGREGGFDALRFFTEPKNICIEF